MTKVFIIHGWTYTLDKWDKLCKLLGQKGINPVRLKVPGLTESSDKVWNIDGYVAWLRNQLKNEKSPVVIGHSNGGRIALAYCQKFPDHFQKLILIDAAGIAHESLWPRTKLKVLRIISLAGKPLARIPIVSKVFYRLIGASDYRNAPSNMKLTMRNMLESDKSIDASKVTVPTTIIWGVNDKSTPLTDGKKLQSLIRGSSLHLIQGAGHSPHATHSGEVARIITEALK